MLNKLQFQNLAELQLQNLDQPLCSKTEKSLVLGPMSAPKSVTNCCQHDPHYQHQQQGWHGMVGLKWWSVKRRRSWRSRQSLYTFAKMSQSLTLNRLLIKSRSHRQLHRQKCSWFLPTNEYLYSMIWPINSRATLLRWFSSPSPASPVNMFLILPTNQSQFSYRVFFLTGPTLNLLSVGR